MSNFRERVRFFMKHAGYSMPPGKLRCAILLAKAETEASERGWSVTWADDPEDCGCEDGPHPNMLSDIGEMLATTKVSSAMTVCG